jgi:hypothetical protein
MGREQRLAKTQKSLEKFYRGNPEGCFICERKPIKKFKYWKIIINIFPYDKLAVKHDMLVPLRHISIESKLSRKEKEELLLIKEKYLSRTNYDFVLENLPRKKSAPEHFHLHLIKQRNYD